jgi:spore germination protein GerM
VRRVVALAVVLLAVTACGLPTDEAPRQIADDRVPFELLGPNTTTTSTTVAGGLAVRLYFVDGTALRAVERAVPNRDIRTVLDELFKGVTEADPGGVTTAIPRDTQIVNIANDGDTLVITLNATFLTIGGTEQRNAFGQIVYTVTDLDVPGVRFRVVDANGGNEQDVQPLTDVGQKSGPLTRADFASLQPQ